MGVSARGHHLNLKTNLVDFVDVITTLQLKTTTSPHKCKQICNINGGKLHTKKRKKKHKIKIMDFFDVVAKCWLLSSRHNMYVCKLGRSFYFLLLDLIFYRFYILCVSLNKYFFNIHDRYVFREELYVPNPSVITHNILVV